MGICAECTYQKFYVRANKKNQFPGDKKNNVSKMGVVNSGIPFFLQLVPKTMTPSDWLIISLQYPKCSNSYFFFNLFGYRKTIPKMFKVDTLLRFKRYRVWNQYVPGFFYSDQDWKYLNMQTDKIILFPTHATNSNSWCSYRI